MPHPPSCWFTLTAAQTGSESWPVGLVVLFLAAALVATLLRRLRIETIPGYLLAGAIVGPHGLRLIADHSATEQIASLATILLMFGIGLQLDVTALRKGFAAVVGLGLGSTLAFIALAWGALFALGGGSAPSSLLLAMALSISSTAVLVPILMARREVRATHGRVALGVSIVQDLMSVAMMALIPPLATWAGVPILGVVGRIDEAGELPTLVDLFARSAVGIGGVTLMIVLARLFLPRLLMIVTRLGSGELLLVVSTALALGAAWLTGWLGFTPEMGAFLAGFMLASTPFRYQLSGQIGPVRDILVALFFTLVGTRVDIAVVMEFWWVVLLAVPALMIGKIVLVGVGGWLLGIPAAPSFLTGVYVANGSEFSLVLIGAGLTAGVLAEGQAALAVAVVFFTLIICPLLAGPSHRLVPFFASIGCPRWVRGTAFSRKEGLDPGAQGPRHVVIAGFGPVGRAIADELAAAAIPFTVIELNPRTVQRQTGLGRQIVFGDVTNPEVLESAGARGADAIIITVPDDEVSLQACRAARALAPKALLAVRSGFLSSKIRALQHGADLVTVEEFATAHAMRREVMEAIVQRFGKGEGTQAAEAEKTGSKV
jgi:CPA2 family monovalent cation:H+ antiporter-2